MATLLNIIAGDPKNFKRESFKNSGKSNSLTQGEKFIKYQKKIKKNTVEGFTPSLSRQTKFVLDAITPLTSSNTAGDMNKYTRQYDSVLSQYADAETGGTDAINEYYARINPNNPYLNKNVRFTSGEICYVTNQGVAKLYPSAEIFAATAGSNGCPAMSNITELNIPWQSEYNTINTNISTNPPLISGSPMIQGQSCGFEGTNVYVNAMVGSNVTSSYKGCFADNATTPAMIYIGGNPPEPYTSSAPIQNPNFDYPQIANNSYQYINSDNAAYDGSTEVTGWNFNACLINNSTAWGFPMPYPYGNQATAIQGTAMLGQIINLNTGNYALNIYAVGRPSPYQANLINVWCAPYTNDVGLSDPQNYIIGAIGPTQTSWQQYTINFNIPSSGNWNIGFWGQGGGGNYATAIQNFTITMSGMTAAGGGGNYTEESCKKMAMYEGYQYYAIQDANSSGLGYCAVSNDYIAATQYGESTVTTGLITLWQSNTSGQQGNTATLNTSGSLVVMNSSGTAVFSTPNNSNLASNYMGCYTDTSTRAFQNAVTNGVVTDSNGPYSWNSSAQSCQQAAQAAGMSYFGLQDSTIEGEAVCFIGNSLSQATEYGPATNCTTFSDGTVNGGSWSNSVYQAGFGNTNYFLSVTDDGLLAIYLGQSPSDQQNLIWSQQGAPQQASPTYTAANSITGNNWIPSGTTLAPGDFVGSPNGYCALIMQSNGNLVFSVFGAAPNCATVNGSEVGGIAANAIYELSESGNIADMSQVAYIDQNSTLYPYDSTNVGLANTYTKMSYFDSPGNTLSNAPTTTMSAQQCQSFCDSNDDCYGFSIINGMCYPKNNSMYPAGQLAQNANSTVYIRNQIPMVPPFGVAPGVNNINSSQFENYVTNGETINNSGDSVNGSGGQFNILNPATNPQLQALQTEMNAYGLGMNNSLNVFNGSDVTTINQATTNVKGIKNYLKDLKKTQKKIKNFDLSTGNILDNSDVTVLQQNYNYMFWSILAIGTVVISMNITKI